MRSVVHYQPGTISQPPKGWGIGMIYNHSWLDDQMGALAGTRQKDHGGLSREFLQSSANLQELSSQGKVVRPYFRLKGHL
jgi:hypothetical protein